MNELVPGTPEQVAFLEELTATGLLIPSGVPGVYGRGAVFESLRVALDGVVTRAAIDDVVDVERLAFPPVLPRRELEAIGYLGSFPHLAGSIFSFDGDEAQAVELGEQAAAHADWSGLQAQTDLVLVPAACYPAYPAVAARGELPDGGVSLDLGGCYVFRNEPSSDPARMQMFHQRELVRFGEPELVADWRQRWCDRAVELLRRLGLAARADVASDPFFGRTGRMLARSQRSQELKFEVGVPLGGESPTAVASFNCHREHFSSLYGISGPDDSLAHTACVGFGLERIALALLYAHGCDLGAWPSELWTQLETLD